MGFKDIKYEGHEGHKGHEGHHVLYFLNAAGSRISFMTFPCVMKVMETTFTFTFTFTLTFTYSFGFTFTAYSRSIERHFC